MQILKRISKVEAKRLETLSSNEKKGHIQKQKNNEYVSIQ